MNARFRQASRAPDPGALFGGAAPASPARLERACCCVAWAVVRVVMPPTPDRPHETELLLCGHHYRVSPAALTAAHAQVEGLPGTAADDTTWFHDDRTRTYATVARG